MSKEFFASLCAGGIFCLELGLATVYIISSSSLFEVPQNGTQWLVEMMVDNSQEPDMVRPWLLIKTSRVCGWSLEKTVGCLKSSVGLRWQRMRCTFSHAYSFSFVMQFASVMREHVGNGGPPHLGKQVGRRY